MDDHNFSRRESMGLAALMAGMVALPTTASRAFPREKA